METSLLILGSVKDLFIQLKQNQHRLRAQFYKCWSTMWYDSANE